MDAGAALREATRLNARKGMGIQVGTVSCSSRGPDDASRAYRVMASEAWSSIFSSLGGKMLFQRHHVDRSSLSHHCHTVLMVAKLQSQNFTDLHVLFRARVCRNWLSNCVFGRSQICPPRRCEKNSRSELPLSPCAASSFPSRCAALYAGERLLLLAGVVRALSAKDKGRRTPRGGPDRVDRTTPPRG